MTAKRLLRRLRLSDADLESIKGAVRDAERGTSGEIALAATGESSDYSFYELFAAVISGAALFALLIAFHGSLESLIARSFWHEESWYLPAFCGIASFAWIAVAFLFANAPAIDRLVIPRRVRSARVYNRAVRHFADSGVYATREGTGILIFISLMEREVRVVADRGISERVAQADWDALASSLAAGIKRGETASALVGTIAKCGEILGRNFPARKENPNELPDGLVILEAGE